MNSDSGTASSTDILNSTDSLQTRKLTKSAAESLLKRLVLDGWLLEVAHTHTHTRWLDGWLTTQPGSVPARGALVNLSFCFAIPSHEIPIMSWRRCLLNIIYVDQNQKYSSSASSTVNLLATRTLTTML